MDMRIKDTLSSFENIVIFSGAGVSTLSGILDYKSSDLYWSESKKDYYTHQELLSEKVFLKDKPLFYEYYRNLMQSLKGKEPNKAHLFAKYIHEKGKLKGVITQNIDGLYQGLIPKDKLCEIHGNAFIYTCTGCGKELGRDNVYTDNKRIIHSICCDKIAKPYIVLYGEPFYEPELDKYKLLISETDCIIVMGTELNIAYHNQSIGNSAAFKVLINKNKVAIDKQVVTGYSKELRLVNWHSEFIGDLNSYI